MGKAGVTLLEELLKSALSSNGEEGAESTGTERERAHGWGGEAELPKNTLSGNGEDVFGEGYRHYSRTTLTPARRAALMSG